MAKRLSDNQAILVGAIVGLLLGLFALQLKQELPVVVQSITYVMQLLSSVFVGLLKMVMVPLVFASIATGVAQLNFAQGGHRIWQGTLGIYAFTTLVATVLGLLSMHVFQPGVGLPENLFANQAATSVPTASMTASEFIPQFVKGLFVNPISAMANGNIMAVVIFAIFVGVILVKSREKLAPLRTAMDQLYQLMMDMVMLVMKVAPIGIAALLYQLATTQDINMLVNLGKFIAVVIGVTVFHGVVILPTLLWVFTKKTPWWFFKLARPALTTAFATSSSAATLPITVKTLQEDMHVSKAVSSFVAPLGAQVNMDGTALYEAAAALFIAQLMGIDLSLSQQLIVVLMSMLASAGAPGMPSAGLVTMMMVLQSVGLPVEAIAILLPIDRLLDAFRTTVNVQGDMTASVIVDRWHRADVEGGKV